MQRTERKNQDLESEVRNMKRFLLCGVLLALLAGCGALDGRRATSNKKSFAWVKSVRGAVGWEERARWVADGKFYTSSGVSAGMDMALGFVSDRFGRSRAEGIAEQLEYVWNDDCTRDVFARK